MQDNIAMEFSKPYDNYIGKWFKSTQTSAYGFIYEFIDDDSTFFKLRFLNMQPGRGLLNGWSIKAAVVETYEPTQADYHYGIINIFKL